MALFLFILPLTIFAVSKTESYKDIIEKAFNLSLQKERNQAINLLNVAAKKESKKNPQALKDIKEAIEQIATVFYTEKAQQAYELANSVAMTDSGLALTQLRESNKIEPENLTIEGAIIRIMIATGDCSGAEKRVEKWLDIANLNETVALLHAQTKICLGKYDEFKHIKSAVIDIKNSTLLTIWQLSEAEVLNKQGQFQKSNELLTEMEGAATSTNVANPEIFYWKFKNNTELKLPADTFGQKYINSCKALTQRSIQSFSFYPFLCKRVTEVESALKASK